MTCRENPATAPAHGEGNARDKGEQKKSALLSRAMLTIMFNPKKPPKIMSSNLYLQLPCQLFG